jgi:sulfatase modifying factor 1
MRSASIVKRHLSPIVISLSCLACLQVACNLSSLDYLKNGGQQDAVILDVTIMDIALLDASMLDVVATGGTGGSIDGSAGGAGGMMIDGARGDVNAGLDGTDSAARDVAGDIFIDRMGDAFSTDGAVSTGGAAGTGGGSGKGGATGTGGGSGKGGATGTGGGSSKGGATGTGGGSSKGGATGTGGVIATGGATTTSMVYGVLGQSCGSRLDCPGGVSCCTQIEVPADSYMMGTSHDVDRLSNEEPTHTTTFDRFMLDKYEVTVSRFRQFVQVFNGTLPAVGSGAHPKHSDSGWQTSFNANMPASNTTLITTINCDASYQTWTASAGVHETMPMNCVSWYVALAFCIWDGGRLPTEAEWEAAATNGSDNTRFPWGSTDPDPARDAVMNCMGDGVSGCSSADIQPVGSRSAGADKWGHLDLAGSLWEWNLDFYDPTYYQTIGTCSNCIDLAGLTPRVIRGGDFTSALILVRATARANDPSTTVNPYVGFRCARSP